MISSLMLAQSGFSSALCCVSIACAPRSKIRAEKKKFFVAIQSLAISIGTSGYGLEHLATPFKGKLIKFCVQDQAESKFRTSRAYCTARRSSKAATPGLRR